MGSSWQILEEKKAPKKNLNLLREAWRTVPDDYFKTLHKSLPSERSERNEDKDGFDFPVIELFFTSNNILYFHLFLHISLNLSCLFLVVYFKSLCELLGCSLRFVMYVSRVSFK